MAGNPWSKFFWQDWESDQALKLCSLAAQGLWMRMLCIAAAHDPIGYVAVAGKPLNETDLARLTGASESEVATLLGELAGNDVFSRDRTGRIYSRRLIRDAKRSANARKNGKLGGNPTLGKSEGKSLSDNRQVKPGDKGQDKPHKPEARYSVPNGTGAEAPDLRKRLWGDGLSFVMSRGLGEPQARNLLGKWRRDGIKRFGKSDGEAKVISLLAEAQRDEVAELAPWMEVALAGGSRREAQEDDGSSYIDTVLREAREREEHERRVAAK